MSITFQAAINLSDFPKKKVFVEDKYEGLDSFEDAAYFENDPYLQKDPDSGRFYEMEADIDFDYEINMSNSNFYSVIKNVDNNLYVKIYNSDGCGSLSFEDLPSFKSKIIKSINTSKSNGVRESIQDGNFYHVGIDKEEINSRLKKMLIIVENAQKLKIGVFWG